MDLMCASLKLNVSQQSVSYPGCDQLCTVHDTEASSAQIFNGASVHANTCKLLIIW